MNVKKIVSLFIVTLISFMCLNIVSASSTDSLFSAAEIAEKISFSEDSNEHIFDNGLGITIVGLLPGVREGNCGDDYYSFTSYGFITTQYTSAVNGIKVLLRNTTDSVLIIRWSESALSSKSFSGIPFLDGMKYINAGNPSATPDSVIAPGQTLTKELNMSNVKFDKSWAVLGEPIPKVDGLSFTLTLKVIDSNNSSQYYYLTSPKIIVKNSN